MPSPFHRARARLTGGLGLAVLSAAVVLVGSGAGAAGSTTLHGTIADGSYSSRALGGTAHYSVYLPAGYATSGKRYPVVYSLHGLPATATAYRSLQQIAAAVEGSRHPAIVIGVQGARAGDTDPEWRNWGAGRNWETATARELVQIVDGRYRTIADRSGRALIGISAGGYGATLIALHNPGVYSVVESWSGYFHATNPEGTAALELGSAEADRWADAHQLIPLAKRFLTASTTPTYYAFYVGTDDALFRDENLEYEAELKKAGLSRIVFRLYSGGHDWSLWGSHAVQWIGKALTLTAAPR
jgi:enterochelin esterase-like enzyme